MIMLHAIASMVGFPSIMQMNLMCYFPNREVSNDCAISRVRRSAETHMQLIDAPSRNAIAGGKYW